jgi:hypothetical protein
VATIGKTVFTYVCIAEILKNFIKNHCSRKIQIDLEGVFIVKNTNFIKSRYDTHNSSRS